MTTPPRINLNPFMLALILVTVLGAPTLISIFALMFGAIPYLVLGTPILILLLRRGPAR